MSGFWSGKVNYTVAYNEWRYRIRYITTLSCFEHNSRKSQWFVWVTTEVNAKNPFTSGRMSFMALEGNNSSGSTLFEVIYEQEVYVAE